MKSSEKLAYSICQRTGILVESHKMRINPPVYRRRDGIAWAVRGIKDGKSIRIFSFDTMKRLNTFDFDVTDGNGDVELIAKE